ncbi:uncharacterized protein LOC109705510 [Ananas comosus]|uniref:Uncharacterized protein LOC109705510 n=1 Tax=Ananas comosus TaxID=4615 RepID=A0A6P5EK22_ANACO|nr:uncharacterized protein LOC109705510 [Ananas comosus]
MPIRFTASKPSIFFYEQKIGPSARDIDFASLPADSIGAASFPSNDSPLDSKMVSIHYRFVFQCRIGSVRRFVPFFDVASKTVDSLRTVSISAEELSVFSHTSQCLYNGHLLSFPPHPATSPLLRRTFTFLLRAKILRKEANKIRLKLLGSESESNNIQQKLFGSESVDVINPLD